MKKYILCTAVICLVFSSGAQAKGCIKGALVGGAAGSMAGHGKLGAVAGCVVGRHNANKADAEKNAQTTGSQPKSDSSLTRREAWRRAKAGSIVTGSSLLMRPGRRPTWREHMAPASAGTSAGPVPTATGKQQPAWLL